jgi:mycobactin lysine-N-oxygenase
MPQRLAVVGAGPKAAALAARCAVSRDRLGSDHVPELLVFEREAIGAAWNGKHNFSSGFVTLCTPAEKDVGFPYDEVGTAEDPDPSISSEIYARFSWGAFMVAEGRYANWVDRDRDHPSHRRFADYLDWVFARAEHDTIPGDVKRIWRVKDKWCLDYVRDGAMAQVVVDGVVLTGNGDPRPIDIDEAVPPGRVFDAETFWSSRARFLNPRKRIEVAVAGDGGSAGTVAAWLAERYIENDSWIFSVSPMGTLFPRGDGHAERRWFTDPSNWRQLSIEHRRKLIDRTEAGVISMRNKRIIDGSPKINYKMGYVRKVRLDADNRLNVGIEYEPRTIVPLTADFLVNAIGFDPWSRLAIVDHAAARDLAALRPPATTASLREAREATEQAINGDLSMPASGGFPPGLHVPALAGIAQGPAMGNLGALGLMARKVLQPYLR